MKDHSKKEPLYRKVNTKARGVFHNFGSDFRHERNTKEMKNFEGTHKSMKKDVRRGLDYTPLYKFLLSKVGKQWDDVYKEAVSRLDSEEPIFWMVAKNEDGKKDVVRCGESSYFSGLWIDDEGILQKVNPDFTEADLEVYCLCCTHTFNGIPVSRHKEETEGKNIT